MKRSIKLTLLTMLLALVSVSASAYGFEVDGVYYDVTSSTDFTCEILKCDTYFEGEVIIPSTVTYEGKTYSVTSIGYAAFYNFDALTSVTITEGVSSISDYAFADCDALTSVTIPEGLTRIGDNAFEDCSNLTSVTIPGSVSSISDYAFADCYALTSVTISEGVSSIGDYAFDGCSNLTSVTIPESVSSIGIYAFADCSSLTSVTIPEGVKYIGSYTFWGCCSLTSVTIPGSVSSIGDYAFVDCSSLTSVAIPNSVTSIGDNAFYECGLQSIIIPRSVESLGAYAFAECWDLTSIAISEGVKSIGEWAFNGCCSLTSVTIPNSVTSIGDNAFYDEYEEMYISDLYLGIGSDCTLGTDALSFSNVTTLHVPYKSTAYESFGIKYTNLKEYGEISVTSAGYGTYYISAPFTLPEGLEAGVVTGVNDEGELTVNYLYKGGDLVPANTALLIKGEKCTELFDVEESNGVTAPTPNLLRGSNETETTTGGDRYYMLSYNASGEKLGFYWGAANGAVFTNGAHKAYLALSDSQAKKLTGINGAAFSEETGVTGIAAVTTTTAPAAVYTLDGRKVSVERTADLPAGLYIVNGKKVIVK